MLPIPTRSVFRNRWWSLAWAAGILWTAVDVSGGFDSKPAGNAADANADANAADAGAANGADSEAAAERGRAQLNALVNSVL